MVLKFAANLTFMFKEKDDLLERYVEAAKAGFKAVEVAFPYEYSIETIKQVKEDLKLEQVLINTPPGKAGELGHASLPAYLGEFRSELDLAIDYCKALQCKRLHIMAGKSNPNIVDDAMGPVYLDNLLYAVERLQQEDIVGLIEPINPVTIPGYFLNNFDQALNYIKKINSPYLKLQLDIFHLQHICGNLTSSIKKLMPHIGHIQIAQVPHRNEPNVPGEIDYKYVLNLLEEEGYDGWIGLEYNPKAGTTEGLSWILDYGYFL
ncbi:hypothetical protein CHUAL_006410 [Chamberlinius hualienensis]